MVMDSGGVSAAGAYGSVFARQVVVWWDGRKNRGSSRFVAEDLRTTGHHFGWIGRQGRSGRRQRQRPQERMGQVSATTIVIIIDFL